jgi:hypothetical protein
MNWKFTLIDSSSVSTVVESPVGWNGIGGNLTRNIIHHGININISTDSFEWVGEAYDLLYTEYQTNGANGQYQVQIDYECAEGDGYTNYFIGAFDFNTFERQCADYCFIKLSVTASKCTDVFMSRMGQDVDIEATTNFDGETISPMSYTTLNIEGQDIFLQNKANNVDSETFNETSTDLSGLTGNRYYDIPLFLPNNPLAEMGNIESGSPAWNVNNVSPVIVAKNGALDNIVFPLADGESDFENYFQFMYLYEPGNNDCINDLSIEWVAKGTFEITPNYNGNATIVLRANKRNPITNADFDDLGTVTIATTATLTNGVTLSIPFDETFTGTTPQPLPNSYISFVWHITIFKSTASAVDTTNFVVAYDTLTNFYMYSDSACPPSVTRSVPLPDLLEFLPTAYMDTDCPLLEVEAELRDCLDRYSITKGSFLRDVTEPSVPKLFTSYEYLFEQCRKIFNIGWGFDNNETELKIARIEHFYKSTIVVDVGLVDKAIFTTAKDLIYGTIMVGYNKWEAEEYNGLDEMNTERQYRRNIDSNPTELDLMSDLISAGYTIEVTRRKNQPRTGTSDWRYDDDLFIINSETIDGFLYAIRGIDNGAANIYSPATRMNYVLTPVRNLLRWFKSIAAATPIATNESQIFTSGTGNYIATGEMTATCQIENQPIAENATISTAIMGDVYYETPIWKTEYVTFTAPFSMADFEDVKVNPYGAIRFRCSDTYYIGNIVEINHDPNEGLAEFKLLIRR